MANGIKLLGVAETNPLIRCEDVYKLRYVRPDKPIGYSEIWEDCTTLRLTIFGKLISDDLQLTLCRFETAGYIPGIQEKDAIGTKAIKGVLELHDAGNLTIKPFLQRKASGKQIPSKKTPRSYSLELITMISEIAVARKTKHIQIQALKDGCHTRMGGSCGQTDRSELCRLCLIEPEAAKLRNHFERRFEAKPDNGE